MILKVFLYWRIGLFVIAYLGAMAFAKIPNGGFGAVTANQPFDYWLSWAQWDGGHYLEIVNEGYKQSQNVAFFPLYPFLIKLVGFLTFKNYLVAGLLISNLSFLSFLFVLKKFTDIFYNKYVTKNTLFNYLIFPSSFFAVAFYSEGLYLLLSTAAFLFFYKKKYEGAAIFIGLAAITRSTGLFLFIALLVALILRLKKGGIQKGLKTLISFAAISLLPFFSYLAFLYIKYQQTPFVIVNVQEYWGRQITDPVSTIVSYLWSTLVLQPRPIIDYFDLSLTLIFISILVVGIRKLRSGVWIYSMLVILIPASTSTLSSMPRYLLSSLGAFLLISNFLEARPKLKMVCWFASISAQIFLLVRYINGYWAG